MGTNYHKLKKNLFQFFNFRFNDRNFLLMVFDTKFLQEKNIHNYSTQEFGPLNKVKRNGYFVNQDFSKTETEMSLYRSNGRGDFRIWFTKLKEFVDANNELVLIIVNGEVNVLNISKYDYSNFIETITA